MRLIVPIVQPAGQAQYLVVQSLAEFRQEDATQAKSSLE